MEHKTKSSFNKTAGKRIGEAYNPHVKKGRKEKKNQGEINEVLRKNEEDREIDQEGMIDIVKEEKQYIEREIRDESSRESIAKQFIAQGKLEAFIDFFYLGWQKTPSLIEQYKDNEKKKEEEMNLNKNEYENPEEEDEENNHLKDENIPRQILDFNILKEFGQRLNDVQMYLVSARKCEDKIKYAENEDIKNTHKKEEDIYIQKVIEKYKKISDDTMNGSEIPIESIYFVQKRLTLSEQYNLYSDKIQSLIDMGNCFEKLKTPIAFMISKGLKEQSQEIYDQHLNGENPALKDKIYDKLMLLYHDLAGKKEKMKQYQEAIEYQEKYLNVLDKKIGGDTNNKGNDNQKNESDANQNIKTNALLNIANLYFLEKNYEKTLETLNCIEEIKYASKSNTLGVYKYNII